MLRRSAEIQEKDDSSWHSPWVIQVRTGTYYRTVISTPGTFLHDSHDQPFSRFPHRLSPFCLLSTMLDINFYYSQLVLCASMITSNWFYTTPAFAFINYYLYLRAFARAHITYGEYISSWRLFRVSRSFKSDNFSPHYSFNILTFPSVDDLVSCTGWFYTPKWF